MDFRKPYKIVISTFVLFLALVLFFPFIWMLLTSFKESNDVFRFLFPLSWKTIIPPSPTFHNYKIIFGENYLFFNNLKNSLIVAFGQVLATTFICSMAGFVFARKKFIGRELLFSLVLLTAFIPIEVTMIPLYSIMIKLNLTSSYLSLFLPFVFSPFGVFIFRQSFMDIPYEYDEAAIMEGASPFQIYWKVILPLTKPALITQGLMQFMWSWNNFLWPLVVMQDPNKKVAQVAIAAFTEAGSNRPLWGEAFATASVATLPILVIFIFLQKYYVKGMLLAGVKG